MKTDGSAGLWVLGVAVLACVAALVHAGGDAQRGVVADTGRSHATMGDERLAALRHVTARWSDELDGVIEDLQERAVAQSADQQAATALYERARDIARTRDRMTARARAFDRGPVAQPADPAEVEQFAAWLRESIETTPEASRTVQHEALATLDATGERVVVAGSPVATDH